MNPYEQQTTSNPTTPSPNKWRNIYIAIIAVLAAATVYLFFNKQKTDDTIESQTEQLELAQTDFADLETDYNAVLARLDEMKSQSVQMDSLLGSKTEEVEALKAKIALILKDKNASASKLKEANGLIAQLNKKLSSFEEQLVALKRENIELTEDNKQLTEDKSALESERNNLNNEKQTLEKKVEEGSVLSASNIRMETLKQGKNLVGKAVEKETNKASKVDMMRISFDLNDNRISESGDKMIYMVVSGPSGNVYGRSTFRTQDGKEKVYTASKIVPYRRGEKTYGVTLDWTPSSNFEKGSYHVDLYHMGYKIGSQQVSLR
ncbi:MAG: hypothetical protein ACR2IL_10380 [Chitinophagaceae bacterium]